MTHIRPEEAHILVVGLVRNAAQALPGDIVRTAEALGFARMLSWLAIAFVSTFPYFHDIVTERFVGVKDWVPILGIEDFLTLGERDVWCFASYRVLLLTLFVQMCAQILWAGWWMDAKYSLYKPFLLVPVGLSMYQITMIVMVKTDAYLNKPDFKLLLVLVFGIILGILYYFKNKALPLNEQESITSVVAQNNNR